MTLPEVQAASCLSRFTIKSMYSHADILAEIEAEKEKINQCVAVIDEYDKTGDPQPAANGV